jgi:hypothetical protein
LCHFKRIVLKNAFQAFEWHACQVQMCCCCSPNVVWRDSTSSVCATELWTNPQWSRKRNRWERPERASDSKHERKTVVSRNSCIIPSSRTHIRAWLYNELDESGSGQN